MKYSTLLLGLLKVSSSSKEPYGKYCGNIINNDIYINFYHGSSNISANIFNKKYECDNEEYVYDSSNCHICMSDDPDDCFNLILEKYNLCPCPPEMIYDESKDSILISSDIGEITMERC